MGDREPTPAFYAALLGQETSDADVSRPYPFCLAHPFETDLANLGEVSEWKRLIGWPWSASRNRSAVWRIVGPSGMAAGALVEPGAQRWLVLFVEMPE